MPDSSDTSPEGTRDNVVHLPGVSPATEATPDISESQPQTAPFYQRCPLTVIFSLLLCAIYAWSSAPNDFQKPAKEFLLLGSFYPPLVQAGEWWRFITATLLHGNSQHLLSNVFGILIFGAQLEPSLGTPRLLLLYLLSVILGLLFSFWFLPTTPTIGASTINYGLIGAYLGLILLIRYRMDRSMFWQELRGAVLFVLMFIIWNTMESLTVNLWAHLGGLLAGIGFATWTLGRGVGRERPHI